MDALFEMSWRRFKVLFNGIFTWSDDPVHEDNVPGAGSLARTVDWGSLEHKPVPELVSQLPGVNRIPVGKKDQ